MAPTKQRARLRARASTHASRAPTKLSSTLIATDTTTSPSAPLDTSNLNFSSFASHKKDKLRIRHNALLHRIEKSAPGNASAKKRRRPSKKLKAGMDGLMDALPALESSRDGPDALLDALDDDDEWEGIPEAEDGDGAAKSSRTLARSQRTRSKAKTLTKGRAGVAGGSGVGKMKLQTLKTRPGAMKRKAKLETGEMERFRKNLAQMAARPETSSGNSKESAQSDRKEQTTGSTTSDRWAALRGFIGQTLQQNPSFAVTT